MKKYNILPIPAPRMTQRDKWAKRPCVVKYFNFRNELNKTDISVNKGGTVLVFAMPIPKSKSKKKRLEMLHKPHDQKPDIDNLTKSVLDALFIEDKEVYNITAYKFWSEEPAIYVEHEKPKLWEEVVIKDI